MKPVSMTKLKNQKLMVFGASFTGKTRLVGKLAEKYDLIWLDFDNGSSTLHQLPMEWQARIGLATIADSDKTSNAVVTLAKLLDGKTNLCEEHNRMVCPKCKKVEDATYYDLDITNLPHNTVLVIDTWTQICNSLMWKVEGNKIDINKIVKGNKTDWDAYNAQGMFLSVLIQRIKALTCNVVMIAHEVDVNKSEVKSTMCPSGGTKAVSRTISRDFDHCVHLERTPKGYTATTVASAGTNTTGSRLNITVDLDGDGLLPLLNPSKELLEELSKSMLIPKVPNKIGKPKLSLSKK